MGGLKNDEAGFVRQISDSGYIIAGITESYGAGGSDLWLVKTDKEGKEQWNNTFGRDRNDWIESIQQTHDGGYILAGVTLSFWLGVNHSEFLMVKTDSNGNEQWYRTFGGVGAEFNPSVGLSPNGGYILGGGTLSFDDANYWLIKTDEDGNMQWDQTFEGYGLHSFLQTTDDGYIINGNLYNPSIIKIDLNGTEQWDIRMKCNELNSVLQTSDGGYILAGIYNSKPLLVKLMAEVSVLTAKFTFEPGNPVANESITFDASASHDPYGNITYYQWDLGGGSYVNTTQRTVTHSYDEGGNYSVGLTVTDDEGEMDSINREITVQQLAPLDERWDQTFGGAGDDRVHSLENTSEDGDALTDGEPVLTPDVPGFGAVVAALGLLVWVGLVGRHRR